MSCLTILVADSQGSYPWLFWWGIPEKELSQLLCKLFISGEAI